MSISEISGMITTIGIGLGLVIATGVGIGYCGTNIYQEYFSHKAIPDVENVQRGYVIPSKLEIFTEDLDNEGIEETLIKYDGKKYLFKLDETGKPISVKYELKTIEIKEN